VIPPTISDLEAVTDLLDQATRYDAFSRVNVRNPKCVECLDSGVPQDREQIYRYGYCRCDAGQSLAFNDKLDRVLESDSK
jgi:hypothetical protein